MVKVNAREEMAQGETGQSRFYIGSFRAPGAPMPESIRDHWGIENCLHCTVDVTYREDQSRVREVHALQNMPPCAIFPTTS